MLEKLVLLIDKMSQTSEFRDGWKEIEPTIGVNHIVTFNWPRFKLKIVSFKMPQNWNGSVEEAEQIEAIDTLYLKDDKLLWKTNRNSDEQDWDKLERALVIDVIDKFLAGEWTPPWKCGFCASRHNGSLKPKW
jgi:hypothetical protein